MNISYIHRFKKEKVTILAGEYHTADTDRLIFTILGSCVSVCLKDDRAGIAGMNNFMLPGLVDEKRIYSSDAGRYGIHSMELMINEMTLRGARKEHLWAKVFGGGHVLSTGERSENVANNNVHFSLTFLDTEKIPIVAKDVGGRKGRRITFHTGSGKVLVEPISKTRIAQLEARERNYSQSVVQRQNRTR